MYKISNKVLNFIEKTMKTSRVELTAGETNIAEVKIQRGILQGDALSQFIFIIAMMLTTTYSRNVQPDTNLLNRRKR